MFTSFQIQKVPNGREKSATYLDPLPCPSQSRSHLPVSALTTFLCFIAETLYAQTRKYVYPSLPLPSLCQWHIVLQFPPAVHLEDHTTSAREILPNFFFASSCMLAMVIMLERAVGCNFSGTVQPGGQMPRPILNPVTHHCPHQNFPTPLMGMQTRAATLEKWFANFP